MFVFCFRIICPHHGQPELAPIMEQQISKAKILIANGKGKRAAASAIGISESCLRKRLNMLNTATTFMGRFKHFQPSRNSIIILIFAHHITVNMLASLITHENQYSCK